MDVSIRLRQEHDFYYKSFLAVFALKSTRWPQPFISTRPRKHFKMILGEYYFYRLKGLIWGLKNIFLKKVLRLKIL